MIRAVVQRLRALSLSLCLLLLRPAICPAICPSIWALLFPAKSERDKRKKKRERDIMPNIASVCKSPSMSRGGAE